MSTDVATPDDLASSPVVTRVAILLGKYESFGNSIDTVAQVVAPLYHSCRRELLAAHYWSFAEKLVKLDLLQERPPWGYSFFFRMPPDHIATTYVNHTGERGFSVTGASDRFGDKFAADFNPVCMSYTRDETDEAKFSDIFIEALSYKLAMESCLSLTSDKDLKRDLLMQAREIAFEGISADFREQKYRECVKSKDFVNTRTGVDGSIDLDAPDAEVAQTPLPGTTPLSNS